MRKGMVVILSAPSGTGKSTICREILHKRRDCVPSVSCTTRLPRKDEKHGRHYFFLGREEFKKKIHHGEFLEWAMVHGEYYGTPRRFIDEKTEGGLNVLLAIDVQGAFAVRRRIPDAVLIFVQPPTWESLKKRLAARHEAPASIKKRLAAAREEVEAAEKYDYIVVNDDLDKAVAQVDSIITAEGLKAGRGRAADLVSL
ncbi:MAG TPA: guanylate kinase [Elusimicrobiota bacterium]|nr:guanylate kinase [Elusimicrobiota bacterium]